MMSDAMNSHLGSKPPPQLHLLPPPLPTKRTIPNLYWNDDANSPSTKRFLGDHCDGRGDETTNSIASMLSQLPQTPSLQQQAMLGNLGDGVFGQQPYQVSGVNWYT